HQKLSPDVGYSQWPRRGRGRRERACGAEASNGETSCFVVAHARALGLGGGIAKVIFDLAQHSSNRPRAAPHRGEDLVEVALDGIVDIFRNRHGIANTAWTAPANRCQRERSSARHAAPVA